MTLSKLQAYFVSNTILIHLRIVRREKLFNDDGVIPGCNWKISDKFNDIAREVKR